MNKLRKLLKDAGIDYVIVKRDGPLVQINLWLDKDEE